VATVLAVATMLASAGASQGDLASPYSAGQNRAGQLRSQINADSTQIRGFEGSISSLQARLNVVRQSLDIQEGLGDTPGVEGVPEATLEEFCLTRPFPGAREADHIQEL
jgi:hypothetical protein